MEAMEQYLLPEVMLASLLLGFIVKKWIRDVNNRWIPTIVALFGALAAVFAVQPAAEDLLRLLVSGALSGLASTGMHQLLKNWLENGKK